MIEMGDKKTSGSHPLFGGQKTLSPTTMKESIEC